MIRSSALLLVCFIPHRSVAQSTTSLVPDATVLPSRTARIRMPLSWTRWDAVLGDTGVRNLAATLRTEALDPLQIPRFAAIQTDIRAASGISAFQLSAGNVVAAANSRVVTAPLILEYGLTSRLTLGAVIPLVETRSTVFAQLNPQNGRANVGPNPALLPGSTALAQNSTLVGLMRKAGTDLTKLLSDCQATPSTAGCSPVLGQQAAIEALLQRNIVIANTLERLYGTDATHPGQAYVPIVRSVPQRAITGQITALATQFHDFLGRDAITGSVAPAAGPGARREFQSLLTDAGLDSLRNTDRASLGDISVGATFQIANTFVDGANAARGFHYRLSANGTFRIGTGEPANRDRLFDVGTGTGQNGIEGTIAADVQIRPRLSATALGSYTAQLGTVDVTRVPRTDNAIYPLTFSFPGTYSAGNVLSLSIIPRYRLAGYLGINGQYSLLHVGADRYTITTSVLPEGIDPVLNPPPPPPFGVDAWTAHQLGFGFSYSTLVSGARGPGAIPFEVSFTHLETIKASGGPTNKTFREQVELKVYLR